MRSAATYLRTTLATAQPAVVYGICAMSLCVLTAAAVIGLTR